MDAIEFTVHGTPKGQPRPRAFALRTKQGGPPVVRVYDPGTAEEWKSQIAAIARDFIPPRPLPGPVALSLHFWLPRPATHFRAGDRAKGLKADAPNYFAAKPDADNLAKAVIDCLTVLRFWHDDAQVAVLWITKHYATDAFPPGACVRIGGAP